MYMAPPKDSQDVTLALADPDMVLCWEQKVKQGRECSLLLEFKNGNVTTTLKVSKTRSFEAKTPRVDSKSLAEKKGTKKKKKKHDLPKLLAYHKRLVEEKGLPPSNLMLKHAAEASSTSPSSQKPGREESNFKCDHCDSRFEFKRNLKKHIGHKHKDLQKPEELRCEEVATSLNMSTVSEERSNKSLNPNDSIVEIDNKSDQELWDQMAVTGKCGFCEFQHPVTYKSMDERMDCYAYPNRGNELYEHMDTNHMDVVEKLDEY